jgi:hypothetical protein
MRFRDLAMLPSISRPSSRGSAARWRSGSGHIFAASCVPSKPRLPGYDVRQGTCGPPRSFDTMHPPPSAHTCGKMIAPSPRSTRYLLRPLAPPFYAAAWFVIRGSRPHNGELWPIDRAGHLVPFRQQPLPSVEFGAVPFGVPTIHPPCVLPPRDLHQ